MTRRWREGGVVAGWLGLTALVTLGSMVLAVSLSGSGAGSALGRGGTLPAFRPGRALAFAPVSPRVLSDRFGSEALGRWLGGRASAPGAPSRGAEQPHAPGPPEPGRPGLAEQVTAQPDLRITMSVDKSQAMAADRLTYTIVVTNVGRGIARELNISSHLPGHTTGMTDDTCGDQPVGVHATTEPSQIVCYGLRIQDPTGAKQEHEYRVGQAALRPGYSVRRVFSVVIEPQTPAGTPIRNHAHVQLGTAANAPVTTSNEVTTVVA